MVQIGLHLISFDTQIKKIIIPHLFYSVAHISCLYAEDKILIIHSILEATRLFQQNKMWYFLLIVLFVICERNFLLFIIGRVEIRVEFLWRRPTFQFLSIATLYCNTFAHSVLLRWLAFFYDILYGDLKYKLESGFIKG